MMKKIVVFLFISLPLLTFSQDKFANTLAYDDKTGSPAANLSVVSWLAGHWRGEAFGGITEEIWSPPLGGSMMGTFKLVVNDKVSFYEIETIIEENSSLILKLKHFNADLTGWEEKNDTVDFPLVKVTTGKIYFDNFTIERISDTEINMYVVIEDSGKKSEVKFNYKKVNN